MSFWRGFEKQAVSIEQLRKFTSKVKNHIRANGVLDPKKMGDYMVEHQGMAGIMKRPASESAKIVSIKNHLGKHDANMGPITSIMHGKIFAKGDMANNKTIKPFIDQTSGKMSGKQKEFMNRSIMAHEMDEAKNLRKLKKPLEHGMTTRQFHEKTFNTHANPGIIMREGNLLASADRELAEPTKKFLGHMRNMDATAPTIKQVMPSYEHGKTRLSRHAIKHISERIMKDRPAMFEQALGKA